MKRSKREFTRTAPGGSSRIVRTVKGGEPTEELVYKTRRSICRVTIHGYHRCVHYDPAGVALEAHEPEIETVIEDR